MFKCYWMVVAAAAWWRQLNPNSFPGNTWAPVPTPLYLTLTSEHQQPCLCQSKIKERGRSGAIITEARRGTLKGLPKDLLPSQPNLCSLSDTVWLELAPTSPTRLLCSCATTPSPHHQTEVCVQVGVEVQVWIQVQNEVGVDFGVQSQVGIGVSFEVQVGI